MGDHLTFVVLVQFFTDKTVTSLKPNAFVACPHFIIKLIFTNDSCRYLTDHGYTFSGLLAASKTDAGMDVQEQAMDEFSESQILAVDLSEILPATMDRNARAVKLEELD